MEDSAIIELYYDRSENAVRETEKKYGAYCRKIAYNILNDRQDAEECVNDTYHKAWDTIPPQRPASLSAYLARITRNTALNRLRSKTTQKRGGGEYQLAFEELESVIGQKGDVEELFDIRQLKELINRFIGDLPADSRLVFIGRYWYFESVSDIAKKTGFSESKVKMLLFRARSKLKELLYKEGFIL